MAIQIINCPACGTFLLEDSAECHACGHVVNTDQSETPELRALPTDQAVDNDMDVCSNCGESCRKGLVRCWNCGAFTRPDIEASYRQRMEALNNTETEQFDLPELDASSVTEIDSMTRRALSTPENLLDALPMGREEDDADDFELSDEVHMSDADDSAFDLSETFQLRSGDGGFAQPAAPSDSIPLAPIEDIPPVRRGTPTPVQEMETIPLLPSTSEDSEAPAPITSLDGEAPTEAEAPKPAPEDDLLKIAADEEAEIQQMRKGIKTKDTFVVYCPQGHRIRVRERFRGKSGKCPRCASAFIVPAKSAVKSKKKTDVEIGTLSGAAPSGRYAQWLDDVHLHQIVPEKLKIKADSLLNDFQTVDIGFSSSEILVATLVTAGGLFGGGAKKKPAVRTAMLEYFANPAASPEGLPVAAKRVIPAEAFAQLVLAQPVPVDVESMFGSIPIFGNGRIAVRLPRIPDDKSTQYLSFSLSEFRAFSFALQNICGIEAFGANSEIPITEHYETFKCHYGESDVRSLQQLVYYEKDPNVKLEISGWKCSGCGLIVGEEARKKEKIGGLNGKGIAKAKCPKCTQKFGSNPMYAIAGDLTAQPAEIQPTAET